MDLVHLIVLRLQPFMVEALRLTVWLALLAAIFMPLERLFTLRRRDFRRGVAADLGYYFVNGLLPGLVIAFPLAAFASLVHRAEPAGWLALVSHVPFWLRLALALVVSEAGAYWGHRLSHEIPFLWRFHAVHHAAEHLDWLVNTRAHPLDVVFTRLCALAPLYVLGLQSTSTGPGLIPVLVTILGTTWSFFIHANVRWRFGVLERVVATPAFHHWHHTNDENINKNYAALLPFLDSVFGTLHLPQHWPPCYGIDEPLAPTLRGQLIGPLLPAKRDAVRGEVAESPAQ